MRIIRRAIFGIRPTDNKINDFIIFPENNLKVTNVDVKNVEPVDRRTKDSLSKSVTLAIEIATKTQEANARH